MKATDVMKELGRQWANATDMEKQVRFSFFWMQWSKLSTGMPISTSSPRDSPALSPMQRFETLAQQDKDRYQQEMKSYTPPDVPMPPSVSRSLRRANRKNAGKPKRHRNPWLCFLSDRMPALKAELPDQPIGVLTSRLSQEWRTLDAADKATYERQSEAEREQYLRAVEEWKAKQTAEQL